MFVRFINIEAVKIIYLYFVRYKRNKFDVKTNRNDYVCYLNVTINHRCLFSIRAQTIGVLSYLLERGNKIKTRGSSDVSRGRYDN